MRMARLSTMTMSIAQTNQMRVRLAGLACLTALRDKERHATLLHVSSFTAKQFREKELHSQRFRVKERRLYAFPRA